VRCRPLPVDRSSARLFRSVRKDPTERCARRSRAAWTSRTRRSLHGSSPWGGSRRRGSQLATSGEPGSGPSWNYPCRNRNSCDTRVYGLSRDNVARGWGPRRHAPVSSMARASSRRLAHVRERRQPGTVAPAVAHPARPSPLIGDAIGRELSWEEISHQQARQAMIARGVSEHIPDRMLGYMADRVRQPGPTSDTVAWVLGRPALTFGEWAMGHAAAFQN
jgi:hypothetical protein